MADPENPAEPKATRTARPARTRAEAPPDPDPAPSPAIPSPIALPNDAVERALRTGDQLGPLEDLFGPAALDELRRLARDAEAASVRGGDRVLILPGIMGSKLGRVRPILDDVIWLNPAHIVLGRFDELRLGNGAGGIEALGVFLFAYLALKLRLRIRGHAAEFHAFDWRLSVDDLAEGLRRNIAGDTRRTHLVCHSMGGLVARAMFRLPAPANIGRIITLGTPHNGSYAPVQAFRGVEATVRKIAALDLLDANPKQKQEHLAAIFGTFPGLLQMIPSPALRQPSLFNPLSWPQQGARPGDSMLARAAQVQDSLPKLNAIQLPPDPKAPDRRIVLIVGSGTETVIAARRPAKSTDNDEFTYDLSDEGDGTVPLDLATVPDLPTYVTQAGHGGMPNDPDIARAVDNILVTGATKLLPELDSLPPVQRRGALLRSVTDSQLSQLGGAGGMRGMSVREQRLLLAAFAAPLDGAAPGAPAPPPTLAGTDLRAAPGLNRGLVVGRRRQFRLEVTLAHGSITEASADAYVLGVFSGVAPAGAAAAVDAALAEQPGGRGPLAELISRRMISGGVGEITALPINRNRRVRADSILLAGLGNIAEYREGPVLETVGESVMRIALMSRLDDFAIVPIGASAGSTSSLSVGQLIRGFMKPLRGLDGARLRGFTICELDDQRYQEIRQTFYQLLREPLFDDVEITLTELDLPVPVTRAGPPAAAGAPEPVYLFVQQAADAAGRATAVGTMLTAGGKAAIIKLAQPIDDAVLDALLAQVVHGSAGIGDMKAFGTQLMRAVLHPDLLAVLARETAPTGPGPAPPLVVVHDAPMSRIPWEAMQLPGRETSPPALAGGLSHRYVGGVLSVAKWMEERQQSADLSILLVVNPTQDLPGAEREGDRIKAIVNEKLPRARLRELRGADARRSDLLDCFSTGEFDVVHYAGHAYFDPANRGRSGILCYNREVLSGADLAALSRLPALVVFNACESARVRRFTGDGVPTDGEEKVQEPVRGTSSFAESFLSGGIANYIGTYWEVQDASALTFGETLYARLLAGLPLGQALLDARNAVAKLQQGADDWADYVFYGDPRFVLKAGPGSPSLPAAGGPVLTAG